MKEMKNEINEKKLECWAHNLRTQANVQTFKYYVRKVCTSLSLSVGSLLNNPTDQMRALGQCFKSLISPKEEQKKRVCKFVYSNTRWLLSEENRCWFT